MNYESAGQPWTWKPKQNLWALKRPPWITSSLEAQHVKGEEIFPGPFNELFFIGVLSEVQLRRLGKKNYDLVFRVTEAIHTRHHSSLHRVVNGVQDVRRRSIPVGEPGNYTLVSANYYQKEKYSSITVLTEGGDRDVADSLIHGLVHHLSRRVVGPSTDVIYVATERDDQGVAQHTRYEGEMLQALREEQ